MADRLSFAGDIRPLFRDSDVNSTSFAFELASYEDVRTHGEAIYATPRRRPDAVRRRMAGR
jgi:hypothetical protein